MSRRLIHVARVMMAAGIAALACGTISAETLRDVLRAQGAPAAGKSLPDLDTPIMNYQVFDDPKNFLIAYHVAYHFEKRSPAHEGPLFVAKFDKAKRLWQTGEIGWPELGDAGCFGAATEVHVAGGRTYLELHINPSASCTIVLSPELVFEKVLSGWFLAAFADGRVIYHNNEIHFAPVHAAEISIFDPRSGQDIKIYPRKPFQAARAAHIAKIAGFFAHNPEWCNAHNNPCDPEWFDSEMNGTVAVSDKTDSLAFAIRFDNTNFWTDAERARLEAFRETRNHWKEHPDAASDALLLYLFSDLGRIGRLNLKQTVLDSFAPSPKLYDFLAAAFEAKDAAPEKLQDFAAQFGPRWGDEALRMQFLKGIESAPEFTNVLYIYRNLSHPGTIEYRELLLDDWKFRFGGAAPAKALDAENLRQIFKN
jgi:hypothetical protein